MERRQRRQEWAERFRALGACPECRHPWSEHLGSENDVDGMCGECAYEFEHEQRGTSAPGCRLRVPGSDDVGSSVESSSVLTELDIEAIAARCAAASPGPWTSFVEGRDHAGGDDFIRVGDSDDELDMSVSLADTEGLHPASTADQDFIAAARQDIPTLIAEVRRLRAGQGDLSLE